MSKTFVPTGDLHIGNVGSLCTEEVIIEPDTPSKTSTYTANEIQRDILKKWETLCDEYQKCDLLLLNGDTIDGRNYKDTGLGTWTTDVQLQAEVLAELVSWLKPREVIATSGSPYHSDRNPNMDKIACEMCGGTFKGGYASININGCRIHAQHKTTVSKSTWQYRATPIARAMVLAELASDVYGHYDIALKSHVHWFNYVGFSHSLGMVLPCWKAYDAFGDTNIEFVDPAVGYVVFEIDHDGSYNFEYDITHFPQERLNPDVVI